MSIQKLADALGLAPSTVSRALNGYADINVKTRQRVQEAARDMKYRPHPVAHRLATGRNGAIALMTSVRAGNYLDASFAALLSGAAEVLREQGYFAMSLALPVGDGELKEMDRLIEGRLVDGVILARTRTFDSRVALLQERRIPFVTHGRTETNAPHAWVDTDNEQAFYVATRRLIELGHSHLGMINGPESMTYAQLRKRGFLRACNEAGIDQSRITIQHCEVTSQAGERAANEILNSPPKSPALCVQPIRRLWGPCLLVAIVAFKWAKTFPLPGMGTVRPQHMPHLPFPPLSTPSWTTAATLLNCYCVSWQATT
ncbi:LacI family DNA-binding transcriptional regulator [Rhodoferax sp. TBRC 17199]|nr:LacI family DNA-binding transcriptional regulator [Rhodoferax sp. TBRC 17199]MDT7517113.1 LacI family DNA-binding transcriptional regulator [Rhodoferax sp. TBRC 17199]